MTNETRYSEARVLYKGNQYDKAIPLLQALAADNHAPAQALLGHFFSKVMVDWEMAVEYMGKAADQGYAEAQGMLGHWYLFGNAGVPQDKAKAAELLRKAAMQGFITAQVMLGYCYKNGAQESTASSGEECARVLAGAARPVKGVPQDKGKAKKWYRKAAAYYRHIADRGNEGAQEMLDELKREGKI